MIDFIYQTLQQFGYTHPLHAAITHLPIGLVIGSFLFAIGAIIFKQTSLSETARHCSILALFAVPPTMLIGFLDWQHFYAGAWFFPIMVKMFLSLLLLILLCVVAIIAFREDKNDKKLIIVYVACLLTVIGIGFFGGEIVYGSKDVEAAEPGNEFVAKGAEVFSKSCSFCHFTDSNDTRVGPGLKGLFEMEKLPVSAKPVSEDSIKKQLETPFKDMPVFKDMPDEEVQALIEYIKTL